MVENENTVCERAADKILQEQKTAEKAYEKASTVEMMIRKALTPEIGKMLVKFCYQDEAFAKMIESSDKELIECIKTVALKITRDKPALSDVEAYAEAVRFYIPTAQVSVNFRVVIPNELDDDLLFLDAPDLAESSAEGQAMILDLFGTGEV